MSKVYFACSIRGGRDQVELYANLVAELRQRATVLTEIFADKTLTSAGMALSDREIHDRDLAWIEEADAVIAEVTVPSLGVGYELGRAAEWGKPVLTLFHEGTTKPDGSEQFLSAMIAGSPQVRVVRYRELSEAVAAVENFLAAL